MKTREDDTTVKHVKRLEEHARYILDSNVLLPEPKIVSYIFVGHRCQGIVCNNRSEIWVRCGYDALFLYNCHDVIRLKVEEIFGRTSSIEVTKDIAGILSLFFVKYYDAQEKIELESLVSKGSLESICYTVYGNFLILFRARVICIAPWMVVRYSRSGSEIQTTAHDHEGYPRYPIEPLFGTTTV